MTKFIATFDLHFGFARTGGHKVPLHDSKAWDAVLKFAADFKPDTWIMGGDILDCGPISHHTKGKPGQTEGLKLLADATLCRTVVTEPAQQLTKGDLIYIVGNHEDWLTDLTDEMPALEGIMDVRSLLHLGKRWKVIPQGGHYNLGKLTFIHGDQLGSGEMCAKRAVIDYERSVRFGHFHTYQVFTKNSAIAYKNAHTGIAVPCLCGKLPPYGGSKPNRWVQGFLFGYVADDGTYTDYVPVIIDGHFTANGRRY